MSPMEKKLPCSAIIVHQYKIIAKIQKQHFYMCVLAVSAKLYHA